MEPVNINKDTERYDELFSYIQHKFNDASSFKEEQASDYQEAWQYYLGKLPTAIIQGGSSYIEPVLQEAIDNILPKQLAIFTNTDDQAVAYRPIRPILSRGKQLNSSMVANAVNRKINDIFLCESNGYEELNESITEALITGGAYMKWFVEQTTDEDCVEFKEFVPGTVILELMALYPDTDFSKLEEKMEKIEIPNQETGGIDKLELPTYKGKLDLMKINRNIKSTYIPFGEVFVDPNALDIKSARYLCHRQALTVGQLIELGFDESKVIESDLASDSLESTSKRTIMTSGGFTTEGGEEDYASDPMERRVFLYEHFIYTSLADKKGKTKLYRVFATQNDLLEVSEIDYIPFTYGKTHTIPGSFLGNSLFKICKPYQDSLSNAQRMLEDNAARCSYGRYYAVKGQYDRRSMMDLRAGGIVEVSQIGAVQPETVLPLGQSHSEATQRLMTSRDRAIGVQVGDTLGQQNLANVAASTVAMMLGQEEIKDKRIAGTLGRTLIKPVFEGLYNILREEAVMLALEDGTEFNTADLPKVCDFAVDITTTGDNGKKAGLLINLMSVGAQMANVPSLGVDLRSVFGVIMREAGITPEEVETFMPTPQPPNEEEMAKQAAQEEMVMKTQQEMYENLLADKTLKATTIAKLEVETSELIRDGEAERKRDEEKSVLGFQKLELESSRIQAEIALETEQNRNVSIAYR